MGSSPRIRFWDGFLTLVATTTQDATVKWCNYCLGDVVSRAVKPGDEIEVVRDSNASLAVVLRRGETVVVAVGALASVSLGPDIEAHPGDVNAGIRIGNERCSAKERESATLGGYDVYVESLPAQDLDTPSACFSLALAADPIVVNAARRSAVLLTHQAFDRLRGERSDASYIME